MSDGLPCNHWQFTEHQSYCPDCGLSRPEVQVAACEPYLKDGETPAECIARNRRDVDGCLTMLIEERRKVEALRAERELIVQRAENAEAALGQCEAEADALRQLLAEVLEWLKDPRLSQWPYMENGDFYDDLSEQVTAIEKTLGAADSAGAIK